MRFTWPPATRPVAAEYELFSMRNSCNELMFGETKALPPNVSRLRIPSICRLLDSDRTPLRLKFAIEFDPNPPPPSGLFDTTPASRKINWVNRRLEIGKVLICELFTVSPTSAVTEFTGGAAASTVTRSTT